MTGMDVLRQCRRYSEDRDKLKLQKQIALDAATRITAGASGGGRSGGVSDKPGSYGVKAKAIETAIEARETMYAYELLCAGEMVAQLNVDAASVMHARMIRRLTVRQTAAALHKSESSVRGLYARARTELDGMRSRIGESAEYRAAMQEYHANGGELPERLARCLSAGEPL